MAGHHNGAAFHGARALLLGAFGSLGVSPVASLSSFFDASAS
jgi:hypothetical protein